MRICEYEIFDGCCWRRLREYFLGYFWIAFWCQSGAVEGKSVLGWSGEACFGFVGKMGCAVIEIM